MGFDKLAADLNGRPVLGWSALAFASSASVAQLVVVAAEERQEWAKQLLRRLEIDAQVVVGGARRRDSVLAGVRTATHDWVVVHDAARPLVTPGLIDRGLIAAKQTGAAIAAVPVNDTIKDVAGDRIVGTPDRSRLWAAQTPQVFRRDVLVRAHEGTRDDATDDAALVEALGVEVRVYEGAYANIKITTPVDLKLAAVLLSTPEMRD